VTTSDRLSFSAL